MRTMSTSTFFRISDEPNRIPRSRPAHACHYLARPLESGAAFDTLARKAGLGCLHVRQRLRRYRTVGGVSCFDAQPVRISILGTDCASVFFSPLAPASTPRNTVWVMGSGSPAGTGRSRCQG